MNARILKRFLIYWLFGMCLLAVVAAVGSGLGWIVGQFLLLVAVNPLVMFSAVLVVCITTIALRAAIRDEKKKQKDTL